MYRYINIIEFALVNLRKQTGKNISLVTIYTLVVAFFASIIFLSASLNYETKVVLSASNDLWMQKLRGGRIELLDINYIEKIKSINGIKRITPRIWGYYFDEPTGAVFTILGSDSLFNDFKFINSSFKGKLDSNQVICGSGFSHSRIAETGDWISLIDAAGDIRSFQVMAVFSSHSDLLTRDLLLFNSSAAINLLGIQDNQFTDCAIDVWNSEEINTIATKIDRLFPNIRVVTRNQLLSTYQTLFSTRGGLYIYGSLISIFAFLILVFERASGLNSREKKAIGILKGTGWQIGDVLLLKFFEGLSISFISTGFGIILAYIHIFYLNAPLCLFLSGGRLYIRIII